MEQSRLIALQNQMNPHFLYNTLDAIRGDALRAGMTELAQTMESLSLFLSYSISELTNTPPLGRKSAMSGIIFRFSSIVSGQS